MWVAKNQMFPGVITGMVPDLVCLSIKLALANIGIALVVMAVCSLYNHTWLAARRRAFSLLQQNRFNSRRTG